MAGVPAVEAPIEDDAKGYRPSGDGFRRPLSRDGPLTSVSYAAIHGRPC